MFNRGDYLQPIASNARSYSSRDDAQIRERRSKRGPLYVISARRGASARPRRKGSERRGTQSYGEVDGEEVFDSPGDRRWIEAGLGEYTDRSKLTTRARE